ncbi:type II secretion system protein GspC [Psychromonas algicola]|uniref:type II secretion system protein GspC n=1 Tax=Psychromonas algicola TaxID=2555642 RepID=UPI001067A224|nr:type II secretion system protein GspC [Psychromonas sp. RZ5]TEW52692.1 type II secretion system protein GspC [Psychromonas sp. RZ5]
MFQQLPKIIFMTISVLIAYQSALLTWSLYPIKETPYNWEPSTQKLAQNKTSIDTYGLQKQFLFGEYEGIRSALKVQDLKEVPKTRLRISLVGIIAASDPTLSSVIIEYKGKQDSYFLDSVIAGANARIDEIYHDRIIIVVDGEQQVLVLDGLDDNASVVQKNTTSKPRRTSRNRREQSTEIALDRKELLSNPSKLLDYINISPVREGNEVKGYRVKPGKDASLFEEAGLQSGDLAVELNGVDLTDTSEAVGLMKEFPTMTEITLTIDRNGELNELFFSIP